MNWLVTRFLRFFYAVLVFLSAAVLFAGGSSESRSAEEVISETAPDETIRAFVSIPPQLFFIREIGGDLVDAEVLVKPGQSPHAYEPTPSQMTALSRADLLFLIGVEFERALLPRIEANLPDLTVVATQEGVDYRTLEAHDHEDEEPEEEEHKEDEHKEDEAGGRDPHIWLSPENGKIIAKNMRDALAEAAPEHRETFDSNYDELVARIDRLDRELSQILQPLEGSTLFVFHPSFGYFADAYGLEQEAIETGGKEPSARELVGIIQRAKEEGVKVIFVQPQFSMRAAETAAEAIGGAVVPIDPLSENWLENLRGIGNTVRAELTEAE